MRAIRTFSFLVFFIGGFTTLVYELTWVRLLKQIFGSDNLAVSTILTVFIGGIAFGSYAAGKLIKKYCDSNQKLDRKSKENFKLGQAYMLVYVYGASQLALGLYAILVPFLFGRHILGNIWSIFAGIAIENIIFGAILKFIISGALLLIPTFLIGLTFPILTELLSLEDDEINAEEIQLGVSNLLAINTLGAILGTLLVGFVLLPNYGVRLSIYLCAILNCGIVALVYLWFKANNKFYQGTKAREVFAFAKKLSENQEINSIQSNPATQLDENTIRYKNFVRLLLVISFGLGYINLGLEVVWTKIFGLIIGSNYSLTLTLLAVLIGFTLGTYSLKSILGLAHRLNISYLDLLKTSLLILAVLTFISSSFFNKLPFLFLNISEISEQSSLFSFEILSLAKFGIVAITVLPVTFTGGLIFALILYLISQEVNLHTDPIGTRVARILYINTIGAILGSFSLGFIAIPVLSQYGNGLHYSLLFLIGLCFILALVPYKEDFSLPRIWFRVLLILITMLGAMLTLPKLKIQEISSGVAIYKGLKYRSLSPEEYKRAISEKILFHKEGINSIVTVTENQAANAVFLKTNGKIEAGKPIREEDPSKADMPTQILLGTLPVLIQPNAQNALLIGMGSGISLKSLINAGAEIKLKKIDTCEIEALVYEAAEKFFDAPKGPVVKGIKIKRHVADARNFLLALNNSRETVPNYDLIISQPSDPWISGSLFTKEFWRLAANNLSDDGIFVQWLQLYSIDPEYLVVALRTFESIFPELVVFRPGNAAELIIIGSKSSIDFNCSKIKELISKNDIKKDLAYININNDAQLLTNLILVPESTRELLDSQDLPANKKTNKIISKINTNNTVHKPILTKIDNLFKNRTNTDDNMLLEFHTSTKLNEFSETLAANEEFLAKYIDPGRIMNFLVEQNDKTLILRLAGAYLSREDHRHQRISETITKYLHSINKTPASYLNLYKIYTARSEFDKADALLYQAKSAFADFVDDGSMVNKKTKKKKKEEKKNELILFEGFIGDNKLDDFQLASLAQLYAYDHNWDKAHDLINKAINYNSKNQELYQIKAKILFDEYKYINEDSSVSLVKSAWQEVLNQDPYNANAYYNLAQLDLLQSNNGNQLNNSAVSNLEKSLKISPNNAGVQLTMAKIYLKQLPDKQLELMKVPKTIIDKAIKYTTNTIVLNPNSIEANYYMADLQYKIGNIKEAYESIAKFMDICEYNSKCVDKVGTAIMDKANALEDKLSKLVAQKPKQN